MLPNCLNDFIGVRCLTQSPKSGFYINDLEGLNLRYAADIVDSDHVSGLEFLKSKIYFATSLVLADLTTYALPYFRMKSILDEILVGDWGTNNLPPSALDRGMELKIKQSRLLKIRVNSIKIKIQQVNFAHSVEIIDGVNTYSWPFTTDANGDAEIFPDFLSSSASIYVTMDDSAINVNNTKVKPGCNCTTRNSQYIVATGWNGSSYSNTTYGLMVQANAECSQNELGCILAHKLVFPILYKSGIEVVKESLTTDRLNSITLLDSEKGAFLLEEFTSQYEKHMKTLIASLPTLLQKVDDCCITCNQSRYVQGLP
jgi:hypothetical protein